MQGRNPDVWMVTKLRMFIELHAMKVIVVMNKSGTLYIVKVSLKIC